MRKYKRDGKGRFARTGSSKKYSPTKRNGKPKSIRSQQRGNKKNWNRSHKANLKAASSRSERKNLRRSVVRGEAHINVGGQRVTRVRSGNRLSPKKSWIVSKAGQSPISKKNGVSYLNGSGTRVSGRQVSKIARRNGFAS